MLAFPCNDFGAEPGNASDIVKAMKPFFPKFHVMRRTVAADHTMQSHIFKWLRKESDLKGDNLGGNFEKFLINLKGEVVGHWGTVEEPNVIRPEI